jgi:Bacterial surface protein, Ig-like domain/K319L-like, PKD domain
MNKGVYHRIGLCSLLCFGAVSPVWSQTPSTTIPGAGTEREGPLATHIYTLRLLSGNCPHPNPSSPSCISAGNPPGDTLPVGSGIFYTFGVFDTGSTVVLINNEPANINDADLLDLCGPSGNCSLPSDATMTAQFLPTSLDVRIWGLDRVDPISLGAPLDSPEVEISAIQVRPTSGAFPTLIGAPVAARTVAHIDYTTIVTRNLSFGTIQAPDIVFFPDGDPQIPNAPFAFELIRRGSFTTALDGASVGPRFDMKRVRFDNQGDVLSDTNYEILYDTGNTTTQMTRVAASALGIDPDNDTPADVFNINTVNGQQQVKGFIIDKFAMTTDDGINRYSISNPLVYVRDDLTNPPRPPFPSGIDVVVGSNYFDQQQVVFDGPNDRLRLFTVNPNAPPQSDAGADQTVECASPTGTMITLDGSDSSDADDDDLTYTWTEGAVTIAGPTTNGQSQATLSLGVHAITLEVDDGFGGTDTDEIVITIEDTTLPTLVLNGASAPPLECALEEYTEAGASANDACEGPLAVDIAGTVDTSTPGSYKLLYTTEDSSGNQAMVTRTVDIVDTTPPEIAVNAASASLWPPNHRYHMFTLSSFGLVVKDACDSSLSAIDAVVAGVTSDEVENATGNGDGNTLADIVIAPSCDEVSVRAERAGSGNGRVYTLQLQVADASGNVGGPAAYQVHVPKATSSGPFAVDDGPNFSANGCLAGGHP